MATIIYEEVTPTFIENTKVEKALMDGTLKLYRITPKDGYVLHNSVRDWTGIDEKTGERVLYRGYSMHFSTVPASYDFTQTAIIDGCNAYGSMEIFARPASEVSADRIFGVKEK